MKYTRFASVLAFMLLALAPCYAHHMAVVVNKTNPAESVSSAHLGRVLRMEISRWPDGRPIVLVVEKPDAVATVTIQRLVHMSSTQWEAFVAAHKDTLRIVDSDAEVLAAVGSTPGAVGLIDVRSVNGAVKVVKVDGRLPLERGYLPH